MSVADLFLKRGAAALKPSAQGTGQRSRLMSYDQPLIWGVMALLLLGLVMVYSASIALPDSPKYAAYRNTHFVMRQLMFVGIGLLAGAFAFRIRI